MIERTAHTPSTSLQLVILLAGSAAALLTCGSAWAQTATTARPVTILDGSGVWRVLHCWGAPLVQTSAGLRERRRTGSRIEPLEKSAFHFMTRYPPAGWTEVDFNDSSWPRRQFFVKYANGEHDERAGGGSASAYLRQLNVRGKFTVSDPAQVGRLWLSLAYRGGVVVYLNGKELARAHLPGDKAEAGSPAEVYPVRAYLRDSGQPWHWWNDREAIRQEAYPLRVRRLEKTPVPANLLRQGTNVLAVEIRAAPYPEVFTKAVPEWSTCGLVELHLQAEQAEGIVPNVVRPGGIQVWNARTTEQVYDVSWGDPHERLKPMVLAGPRSGACSGKVVVSSDQPMKNLRAKLSRFAGPGKAALPASAVQVRYGRFDQQRGSRWGGSSDGSAIEWGPLPRLREDALLHAPPDEVPPAVKQIPPGMTEDRVADGLPAAPVPGALQPVWLLAEIPKDAPAGEYRGTLTINVDGHPSVEVPVLLKVIDWTVPQQSDYLFWMGLIESPEAVALTYNVQPWSDEHCRLVGKSLEWVGKLGGKVLYVPLCAESQYGNAQSLVLWAKGADGKYSHDFSRVEKYLDLAVTHMGPPRFVVLGVWDSCMHVSVPQGRKRGFPRYSVLDNQTGKITTADGPLHGTPESLEFWRPVLGQLRDVLARRKLADAMLLGYCADRQPDEATVEVFRQILPDAGWQATRHAPIGNDQLSYKGGTVPIRYQANVWGGWDNYDPDERRVYGWRHPVDPGLRAWLDRGLFDTSPLCQFRTACEQSLLAERHGLGQIGADFWPVPDGDGKPTTTMVGRFPATSEGNLGIYTGQLLYPGPDGPVPSVRYQMMRENIQECEARIFLERLLLETPSRLPAELAGKIQAVLDERTRWHRLLMLGPAPESALSWPYSDWEARAIALYEAAAEAARVISRAADNVPPR
jgi:hypothetical protein